MRSSTSVQVAQLKGGIQEKLNLGTFKDVPGVSFDIMEHGQVPDEVHQRRGRHPAFCFSGVKILLPLVPEQLDTETY